MATIIVKLASNKVMRDFYTQDVTKVDLICAAHLEAGEYQVLPAFESYGVEGEAGAEEAFCLTNNPSRQDEREKRYGTHRSVSVGDIVEVDGVNFLCDSFGWCEL